MKNRTSKMVNTVNLSPWALTVIVGALSRDTAYWRKEAEKNDHKNHEAAIRIAEEDKQLCALLRALAPTDLESITLTPNERLEKDGCLQGHDIDM